MKTAGKGKDAIGRLAAERLLRQTPPGPHLDTESLTAFADNTLPERERTEALAHMSGCAECREILFLAQPQAAEEQGVFTPAPSRSVVLFRWVAGLAAVAVVGGGAFLAKHESLRERTMMAHQENAPQMYANIAEQKATIQAQPGGVPTQPLKAKAEANGHPEPKHMTAKLNGTMQFDSSDQIHMSNAPVSPEPLNLRGENGQAQPAYERGLRDQAVAAAPAPLNYTFSKARPEIPSAQWSLSTTGTLQRSFDQGKSWREVPIEGAQSGLRAVFSSGTQVWVGGNSGALYHSVDSGLTWARVTPATADRTLSGDITHIEFADTQNGKVNTEGGEVWATSDGGQTWTPQD